jgi:hypothetical protein
MRLSILIILLACVGVLPAHATVESLKKVPISSEMDARSFYTKYCGTPCVRAMFTSYLSGGDETMKCKMSKEHRKANIDKMKWLDTMGRWFGVPSGNEYYRFSDDSYGFINWMTSQAIVLLNTKKHIATLPSEISLIGLESKIKVRAECIAVGGLFTGFGRPHKIKDISQ